MISGEVRALLAKLRGERRRVLFPFLLSGRNELDAAQHKTTYVNGNPINAYVALRRKHLSDLALFARRQPFERCAGPVWLATIWHEANRKRDPDNIVSGGRKMILDALGPGRKGTRGWCGAGLMHCDGQHCVAGFVDYIDHAPAAPGIEVIVAPVQLELPAELVGRSAPVDLRGPA